MMTTKDLVVVATTTGWLLILSSIVFAVGGSLFTIREILNWPVGKTPFYIYWERGFVIAALLVLVLGLRLLERLLEASGDNILAPSGLMIFLIGTVLVIVAETLSLNRQGWLTAPVVAFVILAFAGQAVFGASLLRTGLLPAWVGWATIIWNLGWLVILPITRPNDMYYPWLHYVSPLLMGILLLLRLRAFH